jgi:pSer/pThr/pTyr-binding forkhead associated (FHA) protein
MADDGKLVPQLVETSGPFAGRVHELPYGEHVIGRGGNATVQLDHPDVSRRHARLEVGRDAVVVFDLGSKNGVAVQGKRVREPVRLGHGHTLSIGDLTLRLSHPASQVTRALVEAGETTVTTTHGGLDTPTPRLPGLWVPLLGVAVFGTLVLLLILQ